MTKPKVSSDVERAQIDGSIYDGMMAAVSVPDPAGAGGLRTIAHCPRYDDALAIVTALNRISGGDEVTEAAMTLVDLMAFDTDKPEVSAAWNRLRIALLAMRRASRSEQG